MKFSSGFVRAKFKLGQFYTVVEPKKIREGFLEGWLTQVFRGPFARPVEKCYYVSDSVYCEVIDYAIENYANYPELFLVDNEFCDY